MSDFDDEPKFKAPSYRSASCCQGTHCWMAHSSTAEHPCWGKVSAIDEEGDGEDFYWIHGCEGHTDYPGGIYVSEEQAAAQERAYAEQRAVQLEEASRPPINHFDSLPPEEKVRMDAAVAELLRHSSWTSSPSTGPERSGS